MIRLFGVAFLIAASIGCAHRPAGRLGSDLNGAVSTVEMEPLELQVSRNGDGVRIDAYDAASLFEEGGEHLDADRYVDAAMSYDRIVAHFPDSPYVPPALFNAGLSYEGQGRFADAALRYRQVGGNLATSKLVKDATLRLGACYAELNRWPASIEVFEQALKRNDLNLSERIESMSRRALGLFEIGDLQVAESGFRDAVAYYQSQKEQERIDSPFFVAMAQFYQAHIVHRRFRELPLRLPQKQLEQDMQILARQFLTAQDRYVAAIRLQDPTWASAAGYHVGALYRELYDALIKSPVPPEIDNELKKIIYGEMLKGNLRTLLEKARGVLEKNVEMGERVGVKNGWIEKSSEQLEEISKLLAALPDQQIGPDVATPPGQRRPATRPPAAFPQRRSPSSETVL